MKRFTHYLLVFSTLAIVTSCSTKKNTWVHRTYHNITSYYNIYFNGKEAYKKGAMQIENAYRDDFTKVIPIYKFGTKDASQAGYGEMDRAIKKSSKLIKQHSIKVKPNIPKKGMSKKEREFYKKTEYNKWVDDAYLLIGKAYLQQMELDKAARAFQLVIRKFPNTDAEKLANLWLWRTYLEAYDFVQAERYMEFCLKNRWFKEDHRFELAAYEAEHYLRQKQFDKAVDPLRDALDKAKKKQQKLRIKYIMAQTLVEQNEFLKASVIFNEIAKKSNDYEMAFNARIQQATAYSDGAGNYDELVKSLEELTDDEKNADYLDRIYLALATVAMKEGRKEEAIDYYQKALQTKGSDNNIKAEAYLALANMSYEERQYETAGAYFDSTMTNLSPKHEKYPEIAVKAKSLSTLGKKIKTVEREDSLQRMSRMPEDERNELIDRTIAYVKQQEALKKQAMMTNNSRYNPGQMNNMTQTQGGGWYFYNPSALGFGESEFKRKWGERPLADHWRRSNKTIIETTDETAENDDKNGKDSAVKDPKKREYYLQNLPETEEDFATSDTKIQEALLTVGNVYRDDLRDIDEATKAYEDIIKRYPKSDYALEALYNLYLMHRQVGNSAKAEAYKQRIIREFPDSSKAKALSDPNYANRLNDSRRISEENYQKAYSLYAERNPDQAMSLIVSTQNEFPSNHLADKFALLKAMCIGKQNNLEGYKTELRKVIADYPKSSITPLAKEMLRVAEKGKVGGQRLVEDIYKINPGQAHHVVLLGRDQSKLNQLKFAMVNYSVDFSKTKVFETHMIKVGASQVIQVKTFSDALEAQAYLDGFLDSDDATSKKEEIQDIFLISDENLKTLINDEDIPKYIEFYRTNY